jgi:O-antigen/teichoic acid export membrane protein
MSKSWDRLKIIFGGFRNLTLIGTADIAASGISAIFWFYMASLLGAEQYGQVSYFLSIVSIASTVSLFGFENVVSVYLPKKIRIEPPVYIISIISTIATALVLFAIFNGVGISVYVLGAAFFGLASAEILANGLYRSYSKYLITHKGLMVAFAIGFYHLLGVEGVFLGIGISFFPYLLRIYRGFRGARPDFTLLRTRFSFILNSYVLNLSSVFSGSIDKIIIGPLVGFALLGNYQLGIQFLSVLHIIPSIVYKYTLPQDAGGNPNRKLKKATILFSAGLATLGIVLAPFFIPVLFPKYLEAIHVIQIISISIVPSTINLMFVSKFLAAEKNKIVLISSGVHLAVLVPSLIWLGKLYGINGMAIAFVFAVSIETIYYYIMNTRFKELSFSNTTN